MTIYFPDGTPTLGNTKLKAVLSIADMLAPKLATEINAVTSLDVSCYVYPAGWAPGATTAKGTKPSRLCSKTEQQQFNRTSYELGDLQYVHDPQGDSTAPENKMKTMFEEGLKLYLVERQGLDALTAPFAATQHSVTHYVQLGPQIKSGDRTDENGEFFITQSVIYVGGGTPVDGVIAT